MIGRVQTSRLGQLWTPESSTWLAHKCLSHNSQLPWNRRAGASQAGTSQYHFGMAVVNFLTRWRLVGGVPWNFNCSCPPLPVVPEPQFLLVAIGNLLSFAAMRDESADGWIRSGHDG